MKAKSIIASVMLTIAALNPTVALGQDDDLDGVNPSSLSRLWRRTDRTSSCVTPYVLTSEEQDNFVRSVRHRFVALELRQR